MDFRRASIAHGVPPQGGKPLRAGDPYPFYGERKKRGSAPPEGGSVTKRDGTNEKEMIQIRKRNKTIAIRCTDDEYKRVHRRAQEHGMKLSDFVLRTALGKKIIIAEGLQDVVRQQRAIGNNLNQLTRLANQGEVNIIDLRKLVDEYKAVTEMISEVLREVR